jgi:hypothetical protein
VRARPRVKRCPQPRGPRGLENYNGLAGSGGKEIKTGSLGLSVGRFDLRFAVPVDLFRQDIDLDESFEGGGNPTIPLHLTTSC